MIVPDAGRQAMRRAMIIPAYLPPAGVIDLVQDTGALGLVVLNPHDGPGAAPRPSYREAVRAAHDAGTRVLGYVATGWGARPAAEVLADVDRHRWWYGVDGIFFDEVAPGEEHLPHHAALCREASAGGRRLVVLNPGVVPARGLLDLADVVVTYEGAWAGYAGAVARMPGWTRALAPARVAHLVHGATREQALDVLRTGAGAGYVYVTSGTAPNPWATLPPYLDELRA